MAVRRQAFGCSQEKQPSVGVQADCRHRQSRALRGTRAAGGAVRGVGTRVWSAGLRPCERREGRPVDDGGGGRRGSQRSGPAVPGELLVGIAAAAVSSGTPSRVRQSGTLADRSEAWLHTMPPVRITHLASADRRSRVGKAVAGAAGRGAHGRRARPLGDEPGARGMGIPHCQGRSTRGSPRPTGIERNLVVTQWDWGGANSYIHDIIATDKRNPSLYPHGRIWGVEFGHDELWSLDPKTHETKKRTRCRRRMCSPGPPLRRLGPSFTTTRRTRMSRPWMVRAASDRHADPT